MIDVKTSAYSMTSNESSIQPSAAAMSARCAAGVPARHHPNNPP